MAQRNLGILTAILLLACLLRLGWVLYRWVLVGPTLEFDDEILHWNLAQNLWQQGALVSDDGRFAPRMPAYPLFLAIFAWAGDIGLLCARLAQGAIAVGTVWLVHQIARPTLGQRPALLATLLAALDPYAIFFSQLLLTETLFIFFALLCTHGTISLTNATNNRQPHATTRTALGGALALLTRPSAAGWIALNWLWIALATKSPYRNAHRIAACAATLALLLIPWGLRNYAILGDFAWLSANGGLTLYDAQGPQARGDSDQAFLKHMPELKGLSEIERDRLLRQRAIEQMQKNPGRVARLAWTKFLRTWNPFPNVPDYRAGLAAWAGAIFTTTVLIAALAGLLRSALRPNPILWRWQLTLWIPVLYFTILHMIFIGSVRYRVPLMPFLALAAAAVILNPRTTPNPNPQTTSPQQAQN